MIVLNTGAAIKPERELILVTCSFPKWPGDSEPAARTTEQAQLDISPDL
jgi:hypothetical protein